MCTVTILRLQGDLLRIACNRDEQLTRPAALPPRVRQIGQRRAVMPIDPSSGGTWAAVNDVGLAMALLNYNPPEARRGAAAISRGRIIPSLLSTNNIDEATAAAMRLSPRDYGAFRLLIINSYRLAELVWDGEQIRTVHSANGGAATMFTSSGLGDHWVESPRRKLFEEMLQSHGCNAAMQDAFHRHQWPGREHLSVRMSRADARTVSRTVIEVRPSEVSLHYHPMAAALATDPLSKRFSKDLAWAC